MQLDDAIPWLIHPRQACRSCGSMADYMTIGHMYRISCNSCGHQEEGTFSPPIDPDIAPVRPSDVFIDCSAAVPSAENMLALSKLHKSLGQFRPTELKALIVSSQAHFVGKLYPEELHELQKLAARTRFVVVVREGSPAEGPN